MVQIRLEEASGKDETKKIQINVEFHYTPKHANWLNVAEIEINVMDRECTGRRIGDEEILIQEVDAWTKRRRTKMKRRSTGSLREKFLIRKYPNIMHHN